jgi:hypothetical protein
MMSVVRALASFTAAMEAPGAAPLRPAAMAATAVPWPDCPAGETSPAAISSPEYAAPWRKPGDEDGADLPLEGDLRPAGPQGLQPSKAGPVLPQELRVPQVQPGVHKADEDPLPREAQPVLPLDRRDARRLQTPVRHQAA